MRIGKRETETKICFTFSDYPQHFNIIILVQYSDVVHLINRQLETFSTFDTRPYLFIGCKDFLLWSDGLKFKTVLSGRPLEGMLMFLKMGIKSIFICFLFFVALIFKFYMPGMT